MSRASQITFENNRDALGALQREAYTFLWLNEHRRPNLGLMHHEVWKFISEHRNIPEGYRHNTVARLCELEARQVVVRTGSMFARPGDCPDVCTLWHTVEHLLGPKPEPVESRCFWLVVFDPSYKTAGRAFRSENNAKKYLSKSLADGEPAELVEVAEIKKKAVDDSISNVLDFVPLL